MTVEEAKDVLIYMFEDISDFCSGSKHMPDESKRQMEALDMAIKALEQRWIPCSKKYPDMDERVLVYTVSHDYHVWDCMSNRADNYFWEDEEGLYHDKYEVDLWMPLPKYEEEEND